MKLIITIENKEFTANLYDNETTRKLTELLPITIDMTEMGGYEKYYNLPITLSGKAFNLGTIKAGELMLWSSDCLVLFYKRHISGYSYVSLGKINNPLGLEQALGKGKAKVRFEQIK